MYYSCVHVYSLATYTADNLLFSYRKYKFIAQQYNKLWAPTVNFCAIKSICHYFWFKFASQDVIFIFVWNIYYSIDCTKLNQVFSAYKHDALGNEHNIHIWFASTLPLPLPLPLPSTSTSILSINIDIVQFAKRTMCTHGHELNQNLLWRGCKYRNKKYVHFHH